MIVVSFIVTHIYNYGITYAEFPWFWVDDYFIAHSQIRLYQEIDKK